MAEENQQAGIISLSRDDSSTITLNIRLARRLAIHPKQVIVLLLYLAALLSGLYGNSLLRGNDILYRDEARELAAGSPFLLLAFIPMAPCRAD